MFGCVVVYFCQKVHSRSFYERVESPRSATVDMDVVTSQTMIIMTQDLLTATENQDFIAIFNQREMNKKIKELIFPFL